jgi:hypothetical protein
MTHCVRQATPGCLESTFPWCCVSPSRAGRAHNCEGRHYCRDLTGPQDCAMMRHRFSQAADGRLPARADIVSRASEGGHYLYLQGLV